MSNLSDIDLAAYPLSAQVDLLTAALKQVEAERDANWDTAQTWQNRYIGLTQEVEHYYPTFFTNPPLNRA